MSSGVGVPAPGASSPAGATLPTVEDALALGLTRAEYKLVCEHQGGPPNQVELAMYSLLWSEHCAYKHSKKLLRTLPTEGPHVVMGPGENAGVVDVGGGLVCAFKVESHNHPSAVEPFQGAATGVGGILRDIFALGARPIAVLDSLRFGEVGPLAGRDPEGGDRADGGLENGDLESGAFAGGDASAGLRSRYLLDGAVAGIAHYGNSIGVPTVGGEVYFEAPYEHNCLVNAMALGLAPRGRLVRSAAAGPGNVLVLFGAATGRDGIGGASVLASAELSGGEGDSGKEAPDKRPTVQVGDPFEEKKLLECSLELLDQGLLVALQDLGAAGLTSSACEMASKGAVGIDIDIAAVPLREADMEPFEIMVSESQERMLCVVRPERLAQVLALCEKWEIGGAAIGRVTDSGRVRVLRGKELLGDMPVRALVDDCPLYDLVPERPAAAVYTSPAPTPASGGHAAARPGERSGGGHADSPREALLALLASPNIASRRPLFEHYDAIVQSRTVRRPEEADAAVLVLPVEGDEGGQAGDGGQAGATDEVREVREGDEVGTTGEGGVVRGVEGDAQEGAGDTREGVRPALAVSIDCNGRRVAADPYRGTVEAVLECAANLACAGAQPLGTTNNLNFGNPEKPHVAWQLTESVRGLGDACRALAAPIVGGNVSLYNETPAGPIYPTPVIGMVGHLPDARRAGRLGFAHAGDRILLAGPFAPSLAAAELAKLRGQPLPDGLPDFDIAAVRRAQDFVREAIRAGALASAHDIAEGGLAVALAECCLAGQHGAEVVLDDERLFADLRPDGLPSGGPDTAPDAAPDLVPDDAALFGEGPGGFVLSAPADSLRALASAAATARVALRALGTVSSGSLRIAHGTTTLIDATLAELDDAHAALTSLFP